MSFVTDERVRREVLGRFNPIRGLTPDLLTKRLDAFRVGYLRELAITWDAMEDRDINIRTVAAKRKKAAARLQWDVLMVDGAPKGKAEKHRAALRYFYENLEATSVMEQNQRGGVALLVRQMMDAVGKRFACHEIVWKPVSGSFRTGTGGKDGGAEVSSDQSGGSNQSSSVSSSDQSGNAAVKDAASGGSDDGARGATRPTLLTAEFRFCPLWFFENRTGRLRFIPEAFGVTGVEMADGDWMVTVGDGIMEACSVAYIFKHLSLKDWVAFSEKFGLPGVLGSTDASKDSEQWNQMQTAVASLINDWSAVKNKSDEITLLEVKGGTGNLPFPALVEYMDRKIAAIWRGADLSTISHAGAGQGTGASLQGEESDLLLEDDAQLVTETLNRQVDTFVIEYLFGAGTEPLAYFKLGTGREEFDDADFRRKVWLGMMADGTVVDVLANLTDLRELTRKVGLPLNEEYIDPYLPVRDESGAPVTGGTVRDAEGDIVGGTSEVRSADRGVRSPDGRSALGNESSVISEQLSARGREMLVKAVAEDLQPVRNRIARILQIEDQEVLRSRLVSFLADLPKLKKSINADPESARVLEETMSAALVNGFSEEKK